MDKDWKDRIFEQKGLYDVYRISRRSFPKPRSNKFIFWISLVLIFGLLIYGLWRGYRFYTVKESADFVFILAETSFGFSLSILGFLVAGFAIFASVTKTELFITLAQIPYTRNNKNTEINRLQFVFFNFLNVFSQFLILLIFSLFVNIGFSENSPLTKIGYALFDLSDRARINVNFLGASLFVICLVASLIKLKSFIWNLYQAVLLSIATEAILMERKNQLEE